MDVYFARDGRVLGLYPDDGVPQLLEGRAVMASDYYWHEGMASWEPIASRWESASPLPSIAGNTAPPPALP